MRAGLIAAWLAAGLLGGALAGCDAPPKFASTDITGASFASQGFTLSSHEGKSVSLSDFRGKVVMVFFGFTQCPDVCPTTLSSMAQVMQRLGKDAERVQVLFITLDPERDTQQVLAAYLPQFHPSFMGLYGDLSATAVVARDFKVFYQKAPLDKGGYTIDHATSSYLFDPTGRVRLYASHNAPAESLAKDIAQLLAGK